MHARTATLFDSSRSALLLRADPGSDPIPSRTSSAPTQRHARERLVTGNRA